MFIIGVGYSVLRVRAIALQQAGSADAPRKKRRERKERRVSDRPMIWKEVVAEGKLKLGLLMRLGVLILIAACFAPLGIMFYFAIELVDQRSHLSSGAARLSEPTR